MNRIEFIVIATLVAGLAWFCAEAWLGSDKEDGPVAKAIRWIFRIMALVHVYALVFIGAATSGKAFYAWATNFFSL